jgi:predicted transcriptional regulator
MRFIDDSEYGPIRRFGDAHIYYALLCLDKDKPISRATLSSCTNIGEGSVRKIIEVLKTWKTIDVKQTGITITDAGIDLLKSIPMNLIDLERSEYVIGAFQQGVLVHGVSDKITNGMHQRDKGIIAGAEGSSVFVMRNGRVIMPKNWDIDARDPALAEQLRNHGMKEGDTVIISGASDRTTAAVSAITIALDLL